MDSNHGSGHGIGRAGDFEKELETLPGTPRKLPKEFSIVEKIASKDFGKGEDHMTMRNIRQNLGAKEFSKLHDALLMA